MKQLVLKSFIGCLFMIFLSSCQKPYYPENLDSGEKIPVIQGFINNGPGPYEVTLSWASPFESEQIEPIEDATVFIYDDLGNEEQLTMSTPGHYFTSNDEFVGIPDRIYFLHFELSNGDTYESTPTKLEIVPMTYSLYEQAGTQEGYEVSSYDGEMLIKTYDGLYYYVDMTLNTTQQHYFYYSTKSFRQTYRYIGKVTERCWNIEYLDEVPNIKATIEKNNKQIIKGHKLGFIRYYNQDPLTTEPSDAMGWILMTTFYSVSNEVFNYYQSVAKQLKSNNQIFDPVPSQIKGNIKCLTDTTKTVLGVFEVAAKYSVNTGVYWSPSSERIRKVELSPDYAGPPTTNECSGDPTPPDFWINFF